ncbi:hypothetical protein SDC9_189461 [bioreactor metagenome]|uniref:Uncharacterized protein n=1 Tax=bioreactor metagenome TaxID=1076179 RepID=A0A645HTL0_9ZZZZ
MRGLADFADGGHRFLFPLRLVHAACWQLAALQVEVEPVHRQRLQARKQAHQCGSPLGRDPVGVAQQQFQAHAALVGQRAQALPVGGAHVPELLRGERQQQATGVGRQAINAGWLLEQAGGIPHKPAELVAHVGERGFRFAWRLSLVGGIRVCGCHCDCSRLRLRGLYLRLRLGLCLPGGRGGHSGGRRRWLGSRC